MMSLYRNHRLCANEAASWRLRINLLVSLRESRTRPTRIVNNKYWLILSVFIWIDLQLIQWKHMFIVYYSIIQLLAKKGYSSALFSIFTLWKHAYQIERVKILHLFTSNVFFHGNTPKFRFCYKSALPLCTAETQLLVLERVNITQTFEVATYITYILICVITQGVINILKRMLQILMNENISRL